MTPKRETSIDALRGIAIIGMVLSGTISRNADLPGWLFHAQVGPPGFVFTPEVPGITWVDLVFPFFLFAMGLAFPFSLGRLAERGISTRDMLRKIVPRTFKLFFFAILLGHLSPFHYPEELGFWRWTLPLLAFLGFFLTFARFPSHKAAEPWFNRTGYVVLLALLAVRAWVFDQPVSIHRNDIIILLLADMALFGALIWWFTQGNWWPRLAIMALYLALRLSTGAEGSWTAAVMAWTPLQTLGALPGADAVLDVFGIEPSRIVFYSANFLKYLCIVLPGSIVGDILYRARVVDSQQPVNGVAWSVVALGVVLNVVNVVGLYARWIGPTLLCNGLALVLIYWWTRPSQTALANEVKQVQRWSAFWLVLGLLLEPFEGGIKKDHSTISYFFVTSGLAGFLLVSFRFVFAQTKGTRWLQFMPIIGQNPMVGYVAVAYFILPMLSFVGIRSFIDGWHEFDPWLGVLRGFLLTALMVAVTAWTVRKRLFWKT